MRERFDSGASRHEIMNRRAVMADQVIIPDAI